jgi:serine/arginine repetitive matrix protein 2
MQTAAERARLRRQQEEAEREAQKERARLKAAELQRKLEPPPSPKIERTDGPSSDPKPVGVGSFSSL